MKTKQVNSKERVNKFGEVYTSETEVNNMIDIIKDESLRIDSRFLEPACGNGNFLTNVLSRKLNLIEKKYKKSQVEYERYSIQAVSSLYGIDIIEDNVKNCIKRLFNLLDQNYKKIFKKKKKIDFLNVVKFILSLNIVWGNALSLKTEKEKKPIIFSEWSFVSGSLIKRTDYIFSDLISYQPFDKGTLFSDLGEKVIIPEPKYSYKPTHYLNLENYVKE